MDKQQAAREAFEAAYHKLSFQEYANEMESHRAIWDAALASLDAALNHE